MSKMKRARSVIVSLLGFCVPLSAQQTPSAGSAPILHGAEILSTLSTLVLLQSLPVLDPLDGQRLVLSSELGQMELAPLHLLPDASLRVAQVHKVNPARVHQTDRKDSGTDRKYSPAEVLISPSNPIYYGGEVGFLYGHSTGKFDGDVMQTYMVGEVGNDKFHIIVGTEYDESSGHVPRFRSFAAPR
jgi:hypothetical protein